MLLIYLWYYNTKTRSQIDRYSLDLSNNNDFQRHVFSCISLYLYIRYLFIYTHFSQAGDISRCFPSCSFFTEGPRGLQFQEVLRQILDLKDETPEVALRIRRGTCQTFPQQIESYQVNCFFGGIFWWKLWGKRFWKKSWSPFQVNCACFSMFCGFIWLEYVSVDGFPKNPLRGTVSKLWRCSTEIAVKKTQRNLGIRWLGI